MRRTWLLVGGVLVGGLILLGVALNATEGDDGEATVVASQTPDDELTYPAQGGLVTRVSLGGQGNTPRFSLSGGDYQTTWETGGRCSYTLRLTPIRERYMANGWSVLSATREEIRAESKGDKRTSGEQFLYDLRAGDYYLSAYTGQAPRCPWSVTIYGQ